MELSRRRVLMNALFGAGWLGLRSLATGIPISILANPRRALAESRRGPVSERVRTPPQYIVFSTSMNGDPLNANCPGSYLNPNVGHPTSGSMAPSPLTLAGMPTTAALPWAQLPQALLDRSCFFHHGTYTVIHSDEGSVLELGGLVAGGEMFPSLLSSQLATALGTVQAQPIVLGPRFTAEDLFYQGTPQPILSPASLASILAPPSGPLGMLTQLRDNDLNRLNALVTAEGVPGKTAFIDQYATSQTQVRSISDRLFSTIESIAGNDPDSQITAAVALIQMNVAPVICINIPFGGDNHADANLNFETQQTQSGVASIGGLWSQLVAAGIQDRVSFLSLNVFGRTLLASTSAQGRQHNGNHHVAVMFGSGFKGSVVGGIEAMDGDLGAMSISSYTGAGVPNGGGNVPFSETLSAMALTFGQGVGVDPTFLSQNIGGGTVITPALAAR